MTIRSEPAVPAGEVLDMVVLDRVERRPDDVLIPGWDLSFGGGGGITLPLCEGVDPTPGDILFLWFRAPSCCGAPLGWALNGGPRMPWWYWDDQRQRVVWQPITPDLTC